MIKIQIPRSDKLRLKFRQEVDKTDYFIRTVQPNFFFYVKSHIRICDV
jgi:hypothetical protein